MKYSGGDNGSANASLLYLQAIFDPSQGFFNAVIFVLSSQSERSKVLSFCSGGRWTMQDRGDCLFDLGGGDEDSSGGGFGSAGATGSGSGAEGGDSPAIAGGVSEPLMGMGWYECDDSDSDEGGLDDENRQASIL